MMGKRAHPDAEELFITADAGGSNRYRSRAWKLELKTFADETNLRIGVSHSPPGTSKRNKIEHCLFCHITENRRGKRLRTHERIVELIDNTRTAAGPRVKAKLDRRKNPTSAVVTNAQMNALALTAYEFRGEWNCELQPRPARGRVGNVISINLLRARGAVGRALSFVDVPEFTFAGCGCDK
ncbi:MAG: hypothetical protein QNJ82_14890 [Gammaproteobacteria bacterium]|nr:hypothetical protein [Gammaproteobacteria bacterium]